ncbi:MAG: endonuclease/exonuclease/phosphatase family protein [Treponema sp.]|nr:endonuclease/exonuclease/phosphatase family protein [Treponema sp.]
MKKLKFVPFLFVVIFTICGCIVSELETSEDSRYITIMTWNVHNLFDGKDDGYEYNEFLQSSGWSVEKYMGRINSISAAIDRIDVYPDILILQEIESLQVLEDLEFALTRGFAWSHFANNPESAIGVGILSRFPITEAMAHSITVNKDSTPRPVLEARIQTEGGDIIIFACHWKSKIGGDDATESVRKASVRAILRRIRELQKDEPRTGIIVAGDLNENFDEFYRRGSNIVCAIIPDDPHCVKLTNVDKAAQKDYIVINGSKPPAPEHFPQETIVLFSPWVNELVNGSYLFKNNWETIDHFLVSGQFFDDSGLLYESTVIVDIEPFANFEGIPVSYNPRTGNGLSDHLPLLLTLRIKDVDQ